MIPLLKEILKHHQFKLAGKKYELINRIMEHEQVGTGGDEVTTEMRRWTEECIKCSNNQSNLYQANYNKVGCLYDNVIIFIIIEVIHKVELSL